MYTPAQAPVKALRKETNLKEMSKPKQKTAREFIRRRQKLLTG
jgi:hypothetical protein